ncbi:MAG: HAD family phosphatase [Candidatus Marsarchaeota archaeon]|jgi:epoxide hydrolase-like predicted phosphatase|nr:HAD family phosphatase [Candidatus Marsarchaeota archaeon]
MIRAVVFDLGGVIVRFTNDKYYQYLAGISGKSHGFVKHAIEDRELPLLEEGRANIKDFNEHVAKKLGIGKRRIAWSPFYKKTVSLNYDMLELVDALHKEYITAFLTNVDEPRYIYTEKILDMDLFDYRFQSCYLGMRKPSAQIYRHILKKMHMKPKEVAYIDDRLENVRGAAKIGIVAIHFKNRRMLDVKLAALGL